MSRRERGDDEAAFERIRVRRMRPHRQDGKRTARAKALSLRKRKGKKP